MSQPGERAPCPVCNRPYLLTFWGRIRAHRKAGVRCAGSGELPPLRGLLTVELPPT